MKRLFLQCILISNFISKQVKLNRTYFLPNTVIIRHPIKRDTPYITNGFNKSKIR